MPFPTVESITETIMGTGFGSNSHNVAMPATVNSGDLLVIVFTFFRNNATTISMTTPSGWTAKYSAVTTYSVEQMGCAVFVRDADGTEGGTTVDVVTPEKTTVASAQVYRITGWSGDIADIEYALSSTTVDAFDDSPDPPNLALAGATAKDALWLAIVHMNDDADTVDAYPTNYTDGLHTNVDGQADVATCRRELNAASEDPGVFTLSFQEHWVTSTVAIPAAVPSGSTITPDPVVTTLTAIAPTSRATVKPSPSTISLSAVTPSAESITSPAPASFALSAVTPAAESITSPAPASFALSAVGPDLISTALIDAASITFSLSTITVVSTTSPDPAAMTFSVIALDDADSTIVLDPATLALTGVAPTINSIANPSPASITLTGVAPTAQSVVSLSPAVVTLSVFNLATDAGYNVYVRSTINGSDTLVQFVPKLTEELVVDGLANDSVQWYHVKAVTACAVEDVEPIRLKRVAFDSAGNLILPVPNAPVGLVLTLGAGGQVTASWRYIDQNQCAAPTQFNVYVATGATPFDYDTVDHVVSFANRDRFTQDLGTFADTTVVRVVVRAQASSGAEEDNTTAVQVTADAAAPDPANAITVEAVAS